MMRAAPALKCPTNVKGDRGPEATTEFIKHGDEPAATVRVCFNARVAFDQVAKWEHHCGPDDWVEEKETAEVAG